VLLVLGWRRNGGTELRGDFGKRLHVAGRRAQTPAPRAPILECGGLPPLCDPPAPPQFQCAKRSQRACRFLHVEPAPPPPQLSDQEARVLVTNQVEPVFPPGAKSGTKAEVSISVDDDGKFIGGGPVGNEDTNLYFLPGFNAIRHWKFSPYLKDGKPVPFQATIIFTVP
jgi:hypothetical protein